jgi:hypothetical protein
MIKLEIWEDEDLEPEQVILRNKYKQAELDRDFSGIIPIWATNDETIFDIGYSPYSEMYSYCEVNPNELFQISNLIGLSLPMFNGDWLSETRYISTLERWSDKLPVDPPTLSHIEKGRIRFVDGRHRMMLAHVLKAETIIISVPNRLIQPLSELIIIKVLNLE